jgi:hypothetical protein
MVESKKDFPTIPIDEMELTSNVLFTCKLWSGDVVAISRSKNGQHAFLDPLVNFLKDSSLESEDARNRLKVHYIGREVDKQDPTKYKQDHPGSNHPYAVFFMMVPDESASLNTAESRRRWAKGICLANILPHVARQYSHDGAALNVASDITPPLAAKLPPLSMFLTISDTFNVMRMIYTDPSTGRNPSVAEIMECVNGCRSILPKIKSDCCMRDIRKAAVLPMMIG